MDVLILSKSSPHLMTHGPLGAGGFQEWYVRFHNRALGEWSIFRGPVNTNPLTHYVTFSSNMCELVHVCGCVICFCQPAVGAELGGLIRLHTRHVPSTQPVAPCHLLCSGSIGALQGPLNAISTDDTLAPSSDYSSLNKVARRSIRSKRRRRRRRWYTIL